jgi:hypothetical protein
MFVHGKWRSWVFLGGQVILSISVSWGHLPVAVMHGISSDDFAGNDLGINASHLQTKDLQSISVQ